MAATICCPAFSSRSVTKTCAPAWAKVSAIAAPIPEPAPVTKATLLSSLNILQNLSDRHDHLIHAYGGHAQRGEPEEEGPYLPREERSMCLARTKIKRGVRQERQHQPLRQCSDKHERDRLAYQQKHRCKCYWQQHAADLHHP